MFGVMARVIKVLVMVIIMVTLELGPGTRGRKFRL